MNMPETMPPLFSIERGLPEETKNAKVVFEKYIQTRMGNAEANRLYANGDMYKIFLGSNQNIKTDNVSWNKVGSISEDGMEKLEKTTRKHVQAFLSEGSHERVNQAIENINWYFYFDDPIFVQSQERQWKRNPKFARKIEKVIEQNFTAAFLKE
jgi:hypothetical protein